jgi:hypothetical protein
MSHRPAFGYLFRNPSLELCLIFDVLSDAERLAEAAGRLIDDEKHLLALCQLLSLYPNEGSRMH